MIKKITTNNTNETISNYQTGDSKKSMETTEDFSSTLASTHISAFVNTEKQEETGKKQAVCVRDDKGRIVSGTPNPNGRPAGTRNFSKIFEEAVRKVVDDKTNDTATEALIVQRGIELALGGNDKMLRDLFDRLYGKATQTIDLNTEIKNKPQKVQINVFNNKEVLSKIRDINSNIENTLRDGNRG